tara:strand:- start:247 stop:519 length:273 start_codon:yes stop_codon:yes gene_type:complete
MIKLTSSVDGCPMWLNSGVIHGFWARLGGTVVFWADEDSLKVKETPAEILRLIHEEQFCIRPLIPDEMHPDKPIWEDYFAGQEPTEDETV